MTRLVYLAQPIDRATTGDLISKESLLQLGWAVYSPAHAFAAVRGEQPEQFISRVNNEALACSDAVLALLPLGVQSVGVPMEIEWARTRGVPVGVVGRPDSWSLEQEGIVRLEGMNDARRWLTGLPLRSTLHVERRPVMVVDGPDRAFQMDWLPRQVHPGDAGMDLYCSESMMLSPGEFCDVPCSIRVEFPDNVWGMIVGRSSTFRKRHLLVLQGIIDHGYRGELFVGVTNLGTEVAEVEQGERIAQMIPMPVLADNIDVRWGRVDPESHPRGLAGFGSTGV